MKRFLSLVLSALFVFQAGNASCDAGSKWDERKVPVQPRGLFVPYIPQQQPIINVTAPEQPAPVVNVAPTPQTIAIQQPEMEQYFNIKVDETTTADKITSVLKCAGYLFLAVVGGWILVKLWPLLSLLLPSLPSLVAVSVGAKVAQNTSTMVTTISTAISKVLQISGAAGLFRWLYNK